MLTFIKVESICLITRTGPLAGIDAENAITYICMYKHLWNVYMYTIVHINHVYARVQQYAKIKRLCRRGIKNRKLQYMNIFMIDCISVPTNNTINTLI